MPSYKPTVRKYIKTISVGYFYQYKIYEMNIDNEEFIEAVPITPDCVTRIACNEYELRKILDRDIHSINEFKKRVK